MAVKKNITEATGTEESTTKKETEVSSANSEVIEEKKKEEEREIVTLVYIGPSLPAGLLKTNKIVIGTKEEIKKELAAVLEKYPLVEKMLVPVEKLAEKKDKAKTAGNILNKYYTDIVSAIAASGKREE